MKSWVIRTFGSKDVMEFSEIEAPVPHEDQIQMKVEYAGVNPVDWKIREGYFKDVMEHVFPVVLGWDGAGVITQVGKNVHDYRVGDRVFGYFRAASIQWGTYAEYSIIKASSISHIPNSMSCAVAASLPVASLTAWQALFEFADLREGQTVLIQGASGGVGSMAVQFARMKGARVVATSSSKNRDYLVSLGADKHIDYTKESVAQVVRREYPLGVDVALDCVGGSVTKQSMDLVRNGGVFVTIVDRSIDAASSDRCKAGFVFVYPNSDQLAAIASLYNKKTIQAPFIEEFPLSSAREALEKVQAGHVTGKIILKI